MELRRTLSSARGLLAFWALAGLALLVSHNATFVAQLGRGQSLDSILRETGHGYWALASIALVAVGLAVAAIALLHLRRLKRRATELATAMRPLGTGAYLARAGRYWIRLFAVVALAFLIQENLEHLGTHRHVPGVGAIYGPEYPLALPVMGLITLIGGLIGAAFLAFEHALLDTIRAAIPLDVPRAPRRFPRPKTNHAAVRISPLARSAAGRAPPAALGLPS